MRLESPAISPAYAPSHGTNAYSTAYVTAAIAYPHDRSLRQPSSRSTYVATSAGRNQYAAAVRNRAEGDDRHQGHRDQQEEDGRRATATRASAGARARRRARARRE